MRSPVEGRRLVLRTRASTISVLLGVLGGLACWEVAAQLMSSVSVQGNRVVPSLESVVSNGIPGISNYWDGGLGIGATARGGQESYSAAALALATNSGVTLGRVAVGLAMSIILGIALGLLVAALRPVRLSVSGIAEVMRMLPALAMAPLFILWFGATTTASIAFIVFSVAFIVFLATVSAVANLPPSLIDYPRTLGIKGPSLTLRVILPAILPELRGALVFAGLVSWTSVLAAEMYGLQSGLGFLLSDTLRFSIVERMVVVAVLFSGLALGTMKGLGAAVAYATRWAE